MHRNGHGQKLRVLMTGNEAEQLAPTIGAEPTVSLIGPVRAEANVDLAPADVLLHVVASSSAAELPSEVAALRSRSAAPIILAAYGEPNGIVETGLAVGAADVLSLPQPRETVLFALRKAALANGAVGAGKVLTVFSPKGGAGKTVLSTNIAVAVARSGIETLLVDLDLQFGDAALTMGVAPRATIADLAGSSGATDAEKLMAFVSPSPTASLSLLAAPTRPEDAQAINQVELKSILEAARGAYGAVVVDTGPLFDVAMLAAVDCSDQLLIVCNPEITSLKNVRIGLDTLERLGFPEPHLDRRQPRRRARRSDAEGDRAGSGGRDRLRAARRRGGAEGAHPRRPRRHCRPGGPLCTVRSRRSARRCSGRPRPSRAAAPLASRGRR